MLHPNTQTYKRNYLLFYKVQHGEAVMLEVMDILDHSEMLQQEWHKEEGYGFCVLHKNLIHQSFVFQAPMMEY